MGLRGDEVEAKLGHEFGKRDGKEFSVTPDGTVLNHGVKFLWDAKYKADWGQGHRHVSATDVYEANAFLEAAGVSQIALLYPRLARDPVIACGETELFEKVELDSGSIFGLAVEGRGISARGGFPTFSTNLADGVISTLDIGTRVAA